MGLVADLYHFSYWGDDQWNSGDIQMQTEFGYVSRVKEHQIACFFFTTESSKNEYNRYHRRL